MDGWMDLYKQTIHSVVDIKTIISWILDKGYHSSPATFAADCVFLRNTDNQHTQICHYTVEVYVLGVPFSVTLP